jgi:hypothetical protein
MDAWDDRLRELALSLGADFFGVADLSPVRDYVKAHGGAMLARFPRAISIGVAMPFAIVDQLPRHREDKAAAVAYHTHSYSIPQCEAGPTGLAAGECPAARGPQRLSRACLSAATLGG